MLTAIISPMTKSHRTRCHWNQRTQHRRWLCSLVSCAMLLCTAPAWSQKLVEKVSIDADHMQLNMESGKSVYTGHVRISQGQLVLTGDEVTLEQKNNEIKRITVVGKPARYRHVTETGEAITAESEHMLYSASENKLVLTVNASLRQPDNLVSSQKITYDTLKRIIIAGENEGSGTKDGNDKSRQGAKDKQRVNITLTPNKKIQPAPAKQSNPTR